MNCYNHPDRLAVGICKNCQKGLCRECAVDVGNGLACKDACEDEVRAINETLQRGKSAYQKTGKAYKRTAIIFGLVGGLFLLFGIVFIAFGGDTGTAFFVIPFGLIFCIAALFSLNTGKQITRK